MKMRDIIEKVSAVYRSERDEVHKLDLELISVTCKLFEAEKTNGKDITHNEYNYLVIRKDRLIEEINLKK